jgi:hypothetical protein
MDYIGKSDDEAEEGESSITLDGEIYDINLHHPSLKEGASNEFILKDEPEKHEIII